MEKSPIEERALPFCRNDKIQVPALLRHAIVGPWLMLPLNLSIRDRDNGSPRMIICALLGEES